MEIVHIDTIINLGIPHVGENIFKSLETKDLIECLKVSETWKILAGNILLPRWKGKLLEACQEGQTEIVELLLDNLEDADEVTALDGRGKTALILACEHGHRDLVKLLLDHPRIDINARNISDGETALICACRKGDRELVKLLLSHPKSENIDINAKDHNHDTAYDVAKQIVNMLEEFSKSRVMDLS